MTCNKCEKKRSFVYIWRGRYICKHCDNLLPDYVRDEFKDGINNSYFYDKFMKLNDEPVDISWSIFIMEETA